MQCINVIQAFHASEYYHCDIKASNFIILNDKSEVTICDFGQSMRKIDKNLNSVGTSKSKPMSVNLHTPFTCLSELEMLAYFFVEMWGGSVPWSAIVKQKRRKEKRDNKRDKKFNQAIFDSKEKFWIWVMADDDHNNIYYKWSELKPLLQLFRNKIYILNETIYSRLKTEVVRLSTEVQTTKLNLYKIQQNFCIHT